MEIEPNWLPPYYEWLVKGQEYYDALHAFRAFLKSASLSSPINKAIALTTIDTAGLITLNERARDEDPAAEEIVSQLFAFLGQNATYQLPVDEHRQSTDVISSTSKQEILVEDYAPERFTEFLNELDTRDLFPERRLHQ